MPHSYPDRANGQFPQASWFNGPQKDLKVLTAQVFNVREDTFAGGAKGDGTTDDTAAFQATINAAVAAHGTVLHSASGIGSLLQHRLDAHDSTGERQSSLDEHRESRGAERHPLDRGEQCLDVHHSRPQIQPHHGPQNPARHAEQRPRL
jgi:hypothetical protein